MPEGVIGEMLGDEEERPEQDEHQSEASADAFAATIAYQAAHGDPEVARQAAAFLCGQLHLVEVQTKYVEVQREHLIGEHPLRLAQLRNQLRSQRLRLTFQLAIALIG